MYTFDPTTFTNDALQDSLFTLNQRKLEFASFASKLTFNQRQEVAQLNDRITAIELEIKRRNEAANQ